MGFNTTVVVLNDALGEIENDPKFGQRLASAVKELSVRKGRIDVPAGNHANAASVVETHHASENAVVVVGGNFGSVLGNVYAGNSIVVARHHEEAGQVEILKSLAEKFGYRLSKIPNKKPERRSS
jgi:hypothetical protein